MIRFLLALFLLPLCGASNADELRFDSAAAWQTWRIPQGLVKIGDQGQLNLVKFRKEIDAVRDAHLQQHITQQRGDAVSGGIWAAGSGEASAPLLIDGDDATYWQPQISEPLKDWFIDIDLGRAVLARQIVLRFPDTEGARPLRQFTVYATTGARIQATQDVFKYEPVYRTTQPNHATEIAIPLEYTTFDSVIAVDPAMNLDLEFENRYQVVQYISIVAEEQHADAAIAEIEVLSVGDNISIGARERGNFVNGTVAAAPENLFDADLNTNNLITSGRGDQGWEDAGTWFYVDLGAVFFVDELFLYVLRSFEGTTGSHRGTAGSGHRILYSDGTRSVGTSLPSPESFDYTELLTHVEPRNENLFRIRYKFNPRPMRYLFWHGLTDQGWLESKWAEFMLFSPGHPAQVTLLSDFIDLAAVSGDGRPRVIKSLTWDAELPSGTRLQLRSRSGNALQEEYTFFDRKGEAITQDKWNSSPAVLRGPVDTALVVGSDWGAWSNVYQLSGESFQSESPRRYVQLELILSTNDPEVAPQLNSLSIEFDDALVRQARGRVEPRIAQPNTDTRFTYTLLPRTEGDDSSFDLLRFALPGPVAIETVEVRSGATPITPSSISVQNDSLLVSLEEHFRGDSLSIALTTKLVRNATAFALDLGSSARPGLWQSVEPAARRADIVMLPELTNSSQLIADLQISTPVLTPNGDGIHDAVEISFVAFKISDVTPQVQIFDVAGQRVADLVVRAEEGARQCAVWDGRDLAGRLVRPGIYLYRINLDADSGQDTQLRTLGVAY